MKSILLFVVGVMFVMVTFCATYDNSKGIKEFIFSYGLGFVLGLIGNDD